MKLKQRTETKVSENTMRESNVSKKNTSFSLCGATIITAFVALLMANCPSSTVQVPTIGFFAFVCDNGTATAGLTAPTATTNSCQDCNNGYMLLGEADEIGSNCIANRATTSDLLITQFQGGRIDVVTAGNPLPITEFRRAINGSYDTDMNDDGSDKSGCLKANGEVLTAGGNNACRSFVVEIFNGTSSAVTLSNYALIYSHGGTAWGIREMECTGEVGEENIQFRFDSSIKSPLYDITNAHCSRLVLADSLNSNPMLAPNGFHVVSRVEFNGNNFIPNQIWNAFTYNGDDGVALARLASSYTQSACPSGTQSASFNPSVGSAETWCIFDKFGDVWTTDPGNSWLVTTGGNSTSAMEDGSRHNTFLRKRSVTAAPTADWSESRGCTANCDTASPTITATTQWNEEDGYIYTNVGIDTLPPSN